MEVFKVLVPPREHLSVQALYGALENLRAGKIPHTWHLGNIKIPKPPYISPLKIIGSLHFFKYLGPSEENYNPQFLWITL